MIIVNETLRFYVTMSSSRMTVRIKKIHPLAPETIFTQKQLVGEGTDPDF